ERVPGPVLGEVGTMIEEPSFYPYMTGRENLRHAAALHGSVPARRVDESLEFVKLEQAADKRVKAYSQGMRQRLALARALLWHPKVLLLDEPTNGLDPTGIAEFRESLKQVAATGATVLISSHILAEVEKFVNRVLAIDKGTLRFDGSLTQLLAQAGGQAVRYVVKARDVQALLAALTDLGYPSTPAGADSVEVDVPQAEADDLIFRLAAAGVRVTSASVSAENLESAYLRLVGVDGKPS
ncbi:MAG: ATP-binding cassette domain-containing protein, partial [Trueperaceae bacterium]